MTWSTTLCIYLLLIHRPIYLINYLPTYYPPTYIPVSFKNNNQKNIFNLRIQLT
jgi:hypothetical protein